MIYWLRWAAGWIIALVAIFTLVGFGTFGGVLLGYQTTGCPR
jgi:hypothetical protein